jgi:hypothetical protein
LSSIATDYHLVVARADHRLFTERAQNLLSECREGLHNLVEGYFVLPPLSEFSFGRRGLAEVTRSIKATSYVDAEAFWHSVAGNRYFQANAELVAGGVNVTRVFIGSRSALPRLQSIIQRHRRAGMRVLVALAEEIPLDLCEDYLIADDRVVVQLHLTREGIARGERISIDEQDVRRAVNNFDRLVGGAYEYEQLFPNGPIVEP